MEKKARLSVYLDPAVMRSLADFAARRDQSRSLIAEAAIASSPDFDERREAIIAKRLDGIDRRIQRLDAIRTSRFGSVRSLLAQHHTTVARCDPSRNMSQGARAL